MYFYFFVLINVSKDGFGLVDILFGIDRSFLLNLSSILTMGHLMFI